MVTKTKQRNSGFLILYLLLVYTGCMLSLVQTFSSYSPYYIHLQLSACVSWYQSPDESVTHVNLSNAMIYTQIVFNDCNINRLECILMRHQLAFFSLFSFHSNELNLFFSLLPSNSSFSFCPQHQEEVPVACHAFATKLCSASVWLAITHTDSLTQPDEKRASELYFFSFSLTPSRVNVFLLLASSRGWNLSHYERVQETTKCIVMLHLFFSTICVSFADNWQQLFFFSSLSSFFPAWS